MTSASSGEAELLWNVPLPESGHGVKCFHGTAGQPPPRSNVIAHLHDDQQYHPQCPLSQWQCGWGRAYSRSPTRWRRRGYDGVYHESPSGRRWAWGVGRLHRFTVAFMRLVLYMVQVVLLCGKVRVQTIIAHATPCEARTSRGLFAKHKIWGTSLSTTWHGIFGG